MFEEGFLNAYKEPTVLNHHCTICLPVFLFIHVEFSFGELKADRHLCFTINFVRVLLMCWTLSTDGEKTHKALLVWVCIEGGEQCEDVEEGMALTQQAQTREVHLPLILVPRDFSEGHLPWQRHI